MGLFNFLKSNNKTDAQRRFPREKYSLYEANDSSGEKIFFMANTALKAYEFKSEFPWLLKIDVDVLEQNDNGHPTRSEAKILNKFEDIVDAELKKISSSHFIGRTTLNARREIFYYLNDPTMVNEYLSEMVSDSNPLREFQYFIKEDESWSGVAHILDQN